MRVTSIVTTGCVLLCSLAAGAGLTPGQLKLVERMTKTLEKSRKVDERVDAARTLGQMDDPMVGEPLSRALSDPEAAVRRQAADALWRVGEAAAPAVDALKAVLDDSSPGVRVRAAAALEGLGVPEAELVAARKAGLGAERLRDRILAARDLVGFTEGALLVPPILEVAAAEADTHEMYLGKSYLSPIDVLERLLRTEDRSFAEPVMVGVRAGNPGRRHLLRGLRELEPKPADWNEVLIGQLSSDRTDDRTTALGLLGERRTEDQGVHQWIEPAVAALAETDVRREAISALEWAKGFAAPAGAPLAGIVANDPDAKMRKAAADALEEIGSREQAFPSEVLRQVAVDSLPALREAAVKDPDGDVRGAALGALHTLRVASEEVLPTFVAAARHDPERSNRFKALQYIRDLGTDAESAIPDLQEIIASDADNRGMAEQALDSVKTRPPDFSLDVSTAPESVGTEQALRALRDAGIDFTVDQLGRAVWTVDAKAVRLFLDAGMSPDERIDDSGMRPLHYLFFADGCSMSERPSREATKEITRLLLEPGADPNPADDRGNSPLKLAVMACDADVIRLLLAAGADMYAGDLNGTVPFEFTLWSGTDAADALLEAGYRLPEDKAATYRESYADNPAAQELIRRATMAEEE